MIGILDVITKKRDGFKLTEKEIFGAVDGYVNNTIPEYQISSLLMAIYLNGMDEEETTQLTIAMAQSGDVLDLSPINGIKVDKHSCGGIGDTTSIVLLPLVASAGANIAKLSGRGLGFLPGTIDKFESIPNFKADLTGDELISNCLKIGVAISGQTEKMVPADKKIYALRDVTGTVDSIPLMASSIMSKKIAGGADKIVLEVTFGNGAFLKTYEQAVKLGKLMVNIGELVKKETVAFIVDMNQPLSLSNGTSIEIIEAIETLKGNGHEDLTNFCLELGSEILILSGIENDYSNAKKMLNENIKNGKALKKFKELIINQEGDHRIIKDYSLFKQAKFSHKVKMKEDAYIKGINSYNLGFIIKKIGAGREKKGGSIDYSVGTKIYGKIGDFVNKGASVATIYCNNQEKLNWAINIINSSFTFSKDRPSRKRVICSKITKDNL